MYPDNNPFKSFMMAGFESAVQRNMAGTRIDMIASTHHDVQAGNDYALVSGMGLKTVRDGTRWHLIEQIPGVFNFSSLEPLVQAALDNDVQVIWNLMHYGWPDDLDIFSPEFPVRFARYATEVAGFIRRKNIEAGKDDVPFYTPVNEISYFSWAATDARVIYPHAVGRDHELKRQLVRAAIAAMDAVWAVDPRARFVHVDPLVNVLPPRGREHQAQMAKDLHEGQYQAWDMICGRSSPELGGHMRYLDIIGVNFYCNNQWEYPDGEILNWATRPRDERWKRFYDIVPEICQRYGRPFLLSETSHVGMGRAEWLQEITLDVLALRKRGLPILGVCLYPIIDRHGWDDAHHWHNSGLWDFEIQPDGWYKRILVKDYAEQVQLSQFLFD